MMAAWACSPPPSPGPSQLGRALPSHREGRTEKAAHVLRASAGGEGRRWPFPSQGHLAGGARGRGDKGADVGDASAPIMEDGPTHAAGLRVQPTEAEGTSHRPWELSLGSAAHVPPGEPWELRQAREQIRAHLVPAGRHWAGHTPSLCLRLLLSKVRTGTANTFQARFEGETS